MNRLLGLNIGGTTCSAVIGDASGRIHERTNWPSHADGGPHRMIDELVRQARQLLQQGGPVQAVGVAIGGPLDGNRGVILSPPNLPGWDRVPLADELERALDLPVRVEHDAAACALAEHLWGAGRGVERLAYLTCGTGFGVGIVIDGRPYYGVNGSPPEIGHVAYRDDGPEAFGKRGCFEAFASAASLTRLAAWRFPRRWSQQPPAPQEIAQLARQGDADALGVIDLNAVAVGDAAALLGDLLALRLILIGSLARYLGEAWIDRVRQRLEQQIGPWLAGACEVRAASLGDALQDCSALAAATRART